MFFRFVLEFAFTQPACGEYGVEGPPEWWHSWVGNIHYLHFGIILFGISGITSIIISLVTPPIPEENLYRLTFWSRHSTKVRVDLDQDTQYGETAASGMNQCSISRHLASTGSAGSADPLNFLKL